MCLNFPLSKYFILNSDMLKMNILSQEKLQNFRLYGINLIEVKTCVGINI